MKVFHRTLPVWRLVTTIFTLALLLSTGTARASKTIYDLNRDWSNDQNPNGVWSYNWNDVPISQFQTFWWGQAGWGYLWLGDGCVIKGSYPAGMIDPFGDLVGPAFDWQPGDVMMHALSQPYGGDSTFVNVRWTSPGDGWIEISGTAWDGEIFSDRDVAWMLIVGGNTIAQRQSVIGVHRDDAGARFDSNLLAGNSLKHIRVAAGDVVEFRVLTDTYYGHFVGINETITFHYGAGRD
jgi:hypothetical protein